MLQWFKTKWVAFEAWVANQLPGWKVKLINLGSIVGLGATTLASYLTQAPIAGIVEAKTLMIIMAVVNLLSFWLKDIGTRVENRMESLNGNS